MGGHLATINTEAEQVCITSAHTVAPVSFCRGGEHNQEYLQRGKGLFCLVVYRPSWGDFRAGIHAGT